MRVLEASPINWTEVRQLLGLHVEELAMPAEIEALYASVDEQDQLSGFEGWDVAAELPAERRAEGVVMAAVEQALDTLGHVATGYWRHPVSLPVSSVERVLEAFGLSKPGEQGALPVSN